MLPSFAWVLPKMLPVWNCANALTAISERHRVATIARILELGHRFIAAPFSNGPLGTLPNVQIAAQMPGSEKAERSQRVTRRATVRRSGAEFKTPSFAVRFTNSGLVSIAAQSSKLSATK